MQSKLFKHDRVILVKDDFVDTIALGDGPSVTYIDPEVIRQRRPLLVAEIQAIDELLTKIDAKNFDEVQDKRSSKDDTTR
jgi:hypothetical protein